MNCEISERVISQRIISTITHPFLCSKKKFFFLHKTINLIKFSENAKKYSIAFLEWRNLKFKKMKEK